MLVLLEVIRVAEVAKNTAKQSIFKVFLGSCRDRFNSGRASVAPAARPKVPSEFFNIPRSENLRNGVQPGRASVHLDG